MYEISNNLKDYIYLNKKLIKNIYSQIPRKILDLLTFELGIFFYYFSLIVKKEKRNKIYHDKIIDIYRFLKKNNYLKEPENNFEYELKEYYFVEKQNFVKVSLENSKIKAKKNIKKINFYISVDRKFNELENISPLFLLPNNVNNIGMDGSSGYEIFRLLFNDYLECCEDCLMKIDENSKINFAKDPLKVFSDLGCYISDTRCLETLYKKRSTLKDATHNIVYTFAYPVYIASIA